MKSLTSSSPSSIGVAGARRKNLIRDIRVSGLTVFLTLGGSGFLSTSSSFSLTFSGFISFSEMWIPGNGMARKYYKDVSVKCIKNNQ